MGYDTPVTLNLNTTFLQVPDLTIPSCVGQILVGGYAAIGDGGHMLLRRRLTQPNHPGATQSADGDWWEFVGTEINLFQAGAVGDSQHRVARNDDTQAFINARDIALALGIPVAIPSLPANRMFRLTAPITHEADTITYIGSGASVTTGLAENCPNGGSWVWFDHDGNGLQFRDPLAPANARAFARVAGIGIVRNQAPPGVEWVPTANAGDLLVEYRVYAEDVLFLNSTKAAHIRSAGVLSANNIKGQVLSIGFYCERSSDVQRWTNIHWWPFWTQEANVIARTVVNAYAVKADRADGLQVSNFFSWGCRYSFLFKDALNLGSAVAAFELTDVYADYCGGLLYIDSNGSGSTRGCFGSIKGATINASPQLQAGNDNGIHITGSNACRISVTGLKVTRVGGSILYATGAAHRINISTDYLEGWGANGSGSAAFYVRSSTVLQFLNALAAVSGTLTYLKETGATIYKPAQVAI